VRSSSPFRFRSPPDAAAARAGTPPRRRSVRVTPTRRCSCRSPVQGSTGNSPNITSIEIVANGSNNQLYNSYAQYQLVAIPSFGGTFSSTNNLSRASDNNGYHPYQSDFYYAANFNSNQFVPGTTYSIYLNVQSTNCQPSFVGSFST
jgi:hypothetical protein